MSDQKLTAPRYRLYMADGTQHEIQVANADMVSFDREKARHRDWPGMQEGIFFFQNFVCWHAAVRLELVNMTLGQFEKDVAHIEPIQDPAADDDVDPTPPDPGPGWSSP
jgi:hypothetical protein